MVNCKISYIKDSNKNKYLPWQYYNLFNFITIPMKGKAPVIPKWNLFKKTVHPTDILDNIGILCGSVSGVTIIDIDVKDSGMLFWKKLIKEHPELIAPIVETPNKGLHYYFKYEPELRNSIRLKVDGQKIGIDIRNNGAITVAPPSRDPKTDNKWKWKKSYSLNEIPVKKMPNWLLVWILEHQ